MNIIRRLGRARGPRGAFYDFPRPRRASYIDEWSETRLPWYLRPLNWNWAAIGLSLAALALAGFIAVLLVDAYQQSQPPKEPCYVTVYVQAGNITSYTDSPGVCAVVIPGNFSPAGQ